MASVETVRVKHAHGFMWINKEDYDPKVHVLIPDKEPEPASAEVVKPKGKKTA